MDKSKKKCIIVDDEPAAHYVLINYVEKVEGLELVHQCYNGIEALNFIRENQVDLLFLDIDMPEISGLELLKLLKNPPKTILTTAYSEFALESYEYGVIDYLLKPVFFPRFLTSIDRFFNLQPSPELENNIVETTQIAIKTDGDVINLDLDELLYTHSLGNYVKIIAKHKTYLASITTYDLENHLPVGRFIRIHKSYIISLDKISHYTKEFVEIGDHKLPVGITYRQKLLERMKDYHQVK